NAVPKLRTVLWQFVGKPVSPELMADIVRVRLDERALRSYFEGLLSCDEINALIARFNRLLNSGCHPILDPNRNIPYGWW
ncbi:MAG TPA: hypothetical protein VGR22_02520, partial [Thermomicrobiales bacterium]|nr:hypothetical protein [Thermomicrobiales bacterium]